MLIVGYALAVIARAITRRVLRRREAALGPSVVGLVCGTVYVVLLGLSLGAALISVGVPPFVVAGIAVAIVVVLVVALQESVADVAATVKFLLFRPFRRGELIETMGHVGYVEEILAFTTVLRRRDERFVTLSNAKIHEDGIINYTRPGRLRVDVTFSVTPGENLEQLQALLRHVVAADARVLSAPPVEVTTEDVGASGIGVQVSLTVSPDDYWDIGSELRERIKATLDAEGIGFARPLLEVTLPQRSAQEAP